MFWILKPLLVVRFTMTFLFLVIIFLLNCVRLQDYTVSWRQGGSQPVCQDELGGGLSAVRVLVVFFLHGVHLNGYKVPWVQEPHFLSSVSAFQGAAPALSPSASWWDKGREVGRECSPPLGCWPRSPVLAMALPLQESQELTAWSPSPTVVRNHAWRQSQLTKVRKLCSILNYFSKFKRSFQEASVVLNHTRKSLCEFPCG